MAIDWREVEGKYGTMYFTSRDDFLKAIESEIPVEIRRSYENYVNTKKPENLPKKGDRYQPEWVIDDGTAGWRYKATYDDRYSWGVMRTEIKKKPEEATATTGGTGGQATLPTTNIEAELKVTNARLSDIQELLEDIRDMNKIVGAYFAEKGMTTADKLKKEKDEAAAAAAEGMEEEDDELGNEQ